MLRPTVHTLHDSGHYRLVESFTIDEMAQFLVREAGIKTRTTAKAKQKKTPGLLLTLVLAATGAGFGYLIGSAVGSADMEGALLAPGWQLLLAIPVFLIGWLPLHEAIHALFFKLLGAQKVGFGYTSKGMMVYAYSQRFVMTLRENALVAAMPFVIITSLLFLLIVLVPGLSFLWGITLLIHTLGCIGDFILIRHAWKNRHRAMYTYDDLDEKRTYFFEKE
jgi:hypothetical protein